MMKEIKLRRSIRKYIAKPVEDEKILQLIESARLAPFGGQYTAMAFHHHSGRQCGTDYENVNLSDKKLAIGCKTQKNYLLRNAR